MNMNKRGDEQSNEGFLFYSYVYYSNGTCNLIIWPLCLRLLSKNLHKYFIYPINWVLAYLLLVDFEIEGKPVYLVWAISSILIYFFLTVFVWVSFILNGNYRMIRHVLLTKLPSPKITPFLEHCLEMQYRAEIWGFHMKALIKLTLIANMWLMFWQWILS